MSITALNATGQQTRSIDKNPRLFLNVITWEFRRFFASRLFWYQALGLSGLLLLMIWALHSPDNFSVNAGGGSRGNGEFLSGFVAGTSAGGLLHALPIVLLVLVLLLPFVTADGVTRDVNRRTHELLMTTALPTWAYVWGRYLAGLVISLGLALLLLVSILGMGGLLHLAVADYPLPQIGAVLLLWIGMVLSAVILVSSVGFALCTLLPRLSTLVKVVIVVAWLVGALVIPLSLGDTTTPPTWWVNWDPTSGITARGLLPSYTINPGPAITSEAQFQQFILSVENKMPDLTGWFVPHLLLASLSLLLVLIAALAFKRSRDMLN
ncbi:MAG TPA: ABC transporter permease [Ktedonobacteraceae bacterium]|jgi:ABC-type transport system involved in multi-copper enzyme maturation permease subunit|nr:ABC transporter permease [Ktedonobacteraceae bacterium]